MLDFLYKKTLPNAVSPQKAHHDDSGFDLVLIKKIKEQNGVIWYDTGIAVQPPKGYYFELVGRSSISKSGWMLANNIGIIDASYRGNIMVAMVRVVEDAPEIEIPSRLVQIIPRQLALMNPREVDELTDTLRGEGGFGSSGSANTLVQGANR